MFCANCGAKITEGQNFCSVCGKPVGASGTAASPPPQGTPQGRVERHLQILAILWLVWSALRLIPGIGLLFFGGFALSFLPFGWRAIALPIAGVAGVFLLAYGACGLLAGWGLMQRRPWARILVIILGIISLIHFPFGTALGIYTLWVILPAESEANYRRLSGAG